LAAGTLRAGATYEGYAANCSMLMNLIRATNRFPQRELLFTSSADVFGSNFGLPLTESTPHAPQDWYGLSKSVGEWILRQEKVDHAVFRLPGIFGARVREKSILRQLLFRGLHEGVVSLNARGEALRDFVHIDDLIALILAWLRAPCQGVWNIASGTSSKLSDLVSELRNAWGASFDIALTEEKSARDFDLVFDPSSLRNAFPGVWIKPAAEAFAHYVTALKEMTEESRTLAKV